MTQLVAASNIKNNISLILVALIIFLINPLLCIIILISLIFSCKGESEQLFYLLYLFLALYLGLIISTKVPVSDWLNYKEAFEFAHNRSFSEYMFYHISEPVFYIGTFILNKILFNNFSLYAVTIIAFGYYIFFIAIHKFWKYLNVDFKLILFSVLFIAFFNNLFHYSGHLTRQVIAGQLFTYFMVNKSIFKKNKWIILILSIFIHTSSAILFIIALIPGIYERLNIKSMLLYVPITILGIIIIANIWDVLTYYTSSIGFLNYGFERMENIEGLKRTWYDAGGTAYNRIFYFPILIIVMIKYYRYANKVPHHFIINIFIIIIALMEYYVFIGIHYMQLRFMVYVFLFIPFILPLIFVNVHGSEINKLKNKYLIFQLIIIFASIFRFFYGISSGGWEYANIYKILLYPPILLINSVQ